MLSSDEIAAYHRDGYVIPDFRVPAEVLESIKARHAELLAKRPDFRDYCPALLDHDRGFVDYAHNAAIIDMIEQLIGPDIALWNMSFFAKPAGNGKRTPWHQDGEYWPIRPLATCTVWLAVDDSTPENGCLRVIRGSHKTQALKAHRTVDADDVTLHQELEPDTYDETQAVDIVLKAGQFSLHDVYLLHGSEANTSPRPRRGMTMRFMPTTSLFDRDLAREKARVQAKSVDHSARPVWLMRGVDRHGANAYVNA
ncbi:MAG: phytanoyl-CoA dioxygenase family protein [Burkholderiales bacterium]|nr:phytanoyl-CoA dioxygenase family protein [Burkholderiales bacterium]